jgi:CRISPR-associated protein Csx10
MTAERRWFTVHLVDDLVLSARAATTGTHRGLSVIPSSTLAGLLASKALGSASFSSVDAFELLHGGAMRVSSAWPLAPSGEPAFPVPLSLHRVKGAGGPASNFATRVPDRAVQYQQLRSTFVTPQGHESRPGHGAVAKSAIDRARGSAAEGQLFAYQTLRAGQTFIFCLDAADGAGQEFADQFIIGRNRLGRSRGAEFGRVEIEPVSAPAIAQSAPEPRGTVFVWVCSEIHLRDPVGNPRTELIASDFGLGDAELDAHHSFIRVRRFSPYVQIHGVRDVERVVIEGGSVASFKLRNPQVVQSSLVPSGLGGGLAYVNPPLLLDDIVDLKTSEASPKDARVAPLQEPPLAAWMQRRANFDRADDVWAAADTIVDAMRKTYQQVARYEGLDTPEFGPGRTQWNALTSLARAKLSLADLVASLDDTDSPVPADDKAWMLRSGPDATIRERFLEQLRLLDATPIKQKTAAVALAARELARSRHR